MRLAANLLRSGEADFCVVGGIDSYFHPDTLDFVFAQQRVSTAETRSSFFPGEAAAFLLLGSAAACRRLRLAPCAAFRGVEVAREARLLGGDEECLGEGLAAALAAATVSLHAGERVARVICDVNGERYRTEEWAMAVLRRPDLFEDATGYEAPSSSWGDVGAASGALFAILAAQGWGRGYAPRPYALLFAGSDGGLRAVALLEAAASREQRR